MPCLKHDRRTFLQVGMAFLLLPSASSRLSHAAGLPEIVVYRNPGCACCEVWASGLKADGFLVTLSDDPALDKRRADAGVPPGLAGCHTAFIGDYVIEGHVASDDIKRFLNEKPAALGLAVAGMPMGSPGMESGGKNDHYDVMLFTADGKSRIYASH